MRKIATGLGVIGLIVVSAFVGSQMAGAQTETTPGPTVEPPTVDTTGKIVVSDRYANEKGSPRYLSVYDPQTGAVSDYVNGVFQRQRATTPPERAFLERQAKEDLREAAKRGLSDLKGRLDRKDPVTTAELADAMAQVLDLIGVEADQ